MGRRIREMTRAVSANFSNFNEHTTHLDIVVKCRFGFSRSGLGPGSLISDKFPGGAKSPHLQPALTLNSKVKATQRIGILF